MRNMGIDMRNMGKDMRNMDIDMRKLVCTCAFGHDHAQMVIV